MRDILDSFLTECANITVTVDGVDEGLNHPGVLATKVGYFGVKSTKVIRDQIGI